MIMNYRLQEIIFGMNLAMGYFPEVGMIVENGNQLNDCVSVTRPVCQNET